MKDLLSVRDYEQIIMAVARGSAECAEERCFTEDQVHEVARYVRRALFDHGIARMILDGKINVFFQNGAMMLSIKRQDLQ